MVMPCLLGYDIRIKFSREILSGCSHAVQTTISLVISGKGRGRKQRNKRVMIVFNGNLELCKKILNSGKRKYTDSEIKDIREFLYRMAELQIECENENNSD